MTTESPRSGLSDSPHIEGGVDEVVTLAREFIMKASVGRERYTANELLAQFDAKVSAIPPQRGPSKTKLPGSPESGGGPIPSPDTVTGEMIKQAAGDMYRIDWPKAKHGWEEHAADKGLVWDRYTNLAKAALSRPRAAGSPPNQEGPKALDENEVSWRIGQEPTPQMIVAMRHELDVPIHRQISDRELICAFKAAISTHAIARRLVGGGE